MASKRKSAKKRRTGLKRRFTTSSSNSLNSSSNKENIDDFLPPKKKLRGYQTRSQTAIEKIGRSDTDIKVLWSVIISISVLNVTFNVILNSTHTVSQIKSEIWRQYKEYKINQSKRKSKSDTNLKTKTKSKTNKSKRTSKLKSKSKLIKSSLTKPLE